MVSSRQARTFSSSNPEDLRKIQSLLEETKQEFGAFRLVVLGMQGCGKSYFIRHLFPSTCIITPVPEESREVYANSPQDIVDYYESMREGDMLVVDEADRFWPRRGQKTPRDIIDYHRHYGIDLVFAARRPLSLHSDVVELATDLVVFYLPGVDDRAYLNARHQDLGDNVRALPKHSCVVVHGGEMR